MPISVAITDDHPLAIAGLQNMLSNFHDIVVQSTYETGEALLEGIKQEQPDVLLLDIELPDYKGQDLAGIISKQYPCTKILAITSHDAPIHVKSMLKHGCRGYILKNTRLKPLIDAIEAVHRGENYLDPVLKEQMMQNVQQYKRSSGLKQPNLTTREKEILKLIIEEHTNQEIADKLFLSLRTVENHRFSLLQKLEVKNSIGLVRAAIELGLVN